MIEGWAGAAVTELRWMRRTGIFRFFGADAEEIARALGGLLGAKVRRGKGGAWVVDPRRPA